MSIEENKALMALQPASMERWREYLRLAGVGVLAGLIVGLVAGVGARLVMRLIALALGLEPVFTSATLNVVLFVGVGGDVAAALLLVAIRKYLHGNTLMKGLTFGVLLLLLVALFFFLPIPPTELQAAPLPGSMLFTLLCLLTGIALVMTVARLEHALPAPRLRLLSLLGYGFLILLGVCSVVLVLATDVAPTVIELLHHAES
ncbi:MAG: hypothetical protein NVS2B12_11580 [Ktedonobacteraceae bacterium]